MKDPVRLEALQALDAIERHGSFAAAAASLYRVPSAVSYTIAQLESELGIDVFDRRGHRAVLTPAGRLLLDEGRRILAATRELGAAAQRLADRREPELRIAIDALVAASELWPAIAALAREQPETNVRLRQETLGGTWEALVDERVDLAIGVFDPPATSGIVRIGHVDIETIFCCAPGHPLAHASTPLAADVVRAHRIVIVADSAHRFSPRDGNNLLLDTQRRLTVTHMHAKIEAIEAGLGVGFCPMRWIAPLLESGRLVTPALADAQGPVRVEALCRSGERGRALQWLIDYLRRDGRPRSELWLS